MVFVCQVVDESSALVREVRLEHAVSEPQRHRLGIEGHQRGQNLVGVPLESGGLREGVDDTCSLESKALLNL